MKLRTIVVAPAVAALVGLGGAGAAYAATTSPTTSSSASTAKPHHRALLPQHGSFQRGKIMNLGPQDSSLTLRSPDGFTQTYAITSATFVRAKRRAIPASQLQDGDRAMVFGVPGSGTATNAYLIRCVHEAAHSRS